MSFFQIKLLILCLITLTSLNYFTSMDLSSEIIETLNKDHVRMKNFKENFRRMSCKLLVNAKLRALFETEELDKFTNQITPETRGAYLDKLQDALFQACMKTYREDKLIFEKELFYSYPTDDEQYRKYLDVNYQELLEEFPKYTAPERPNKKTNNKKERKDKLSQETENINNQSTAENEGKEKKEREEKVDL